MSPSFNDNENLLYSIFIYILFVCIPLCLLFGLLGAPLDEAEDVDPEEAAGPDVDDPEAGGNNQEVEGLSRHPEEAGTLECREELLSGQ